MGLAIAYLGIMVCLVWLLYLHNRLMRFLSNIDRAIKAANAVEKDEPPRTSSWPPKPGEPSKWGPVQALTPEQQAKFRAKQRKVENARTRTRVAELKVEYASVIDENKRALERYETATNEERRQDATQWYGRHQAASARATRLDVKLQQLGWDVMEDKWIREPKDDDATPAAEQ